MSRGRVEYRMIDLSSLGALRPVRDPYDPGESPGRGARFIIPEQPTGFGRVRFNHKPLHSDTEVYYDHVHGQRARSARTSSVLSGKPPYFAKRLSLSESIRATASERWRKLSSPNCEVSSNCSMLRCRLKGLS